MLLSTSRNWKQINYGLYCKVALTKLAVLVHRSCMVWRHDIYPTTSSASPPLIAAVLASSVIILAASDPTYTAVHCRRSCVSGGWKTPLDLLSAALRHLSCSNADCFPISPHHHHHYHHSLLVQLTYRSRTQGSFKNLTRHTMSTSKKISNSPYTGLV